MTTTSATAATIADLTKHPGRGELIDGEIIEMAPAGFEHGRVVARISRILGEFVERSDLPGVVLAGDPGFIIDEHNVRAPDVAYLTRERAAMAPETGFMPFMPTLAVEVVSPGDTYSEVVAKARLWIRSGVSQVWVVDPRNRTIEVHRGGCAVAVLDETATIDGADLLPGFSRPVSNFF
jgi:Uma2 family endonuclease